jgi:hypothetical protein
LVGPPETIVLVGFSKTIPLVGLSDAIALVGLSETTALVELSEATMLVELPGDTTPVPVILFVWADAAPPQKSATDEITAKYTLRFCFFLSANAFIIFNKLNFQIHFRESPWIRTLQNAMRRNTKIWFNEKTSDEANRVV